jgi:hypothetical protein
VSGRFDYTDAVLRELYFGEYDGCVPEGMADDLMEVIRDKFLLPLDYALHCAEAFIPESIRGRVYFSGYVSPSWQGNTTVLGLLEHMDSAALSIVVYHHVEKAWNYSFADERMFEAHLLGIVDAVRDQLRKVSFFGDRVTLSPDQEKRLIAEGLDIRSLTAHR